MTLRDRARRLGRRSLYELGVQPPSTTSAEAEAATRTGSVIFGLGALGIGAAILLRGRRSIGR